jgi:hypothetical protein
MYTMKRAAQGAAKKRGVRMKTETHFIRDGSDRIFPSRSAAANARGFVRVGGDFDEGKHRRDSKGKFVGTGSVLKGKDGSIAKSIKRWAKAEAHPKTGLRGVPRKAGGRH